MKTQEHTAGATAGAKRAAHFIYYKWPTARPEAELAEYIDRETRLPQLLEALELVLRGEFGGLLENKKIAGINGTYWEKAIAAYRSAKGETL